MKIEALYLQYSKTNSIIPLADVFKSISDDKSLSK